MAEILEEPINPVSVSENTVKTEKEVPSPQKDENNQSRNSVLEIDSDNDNENQVDISDMLRVSKKLVKFCR